MEKIIDLNAYRKNKEEKTRKEIYDNLPLKGRVMLSEEVRSTSANIGEINKLFTFMQESFFSGGEYIDILDLIGYDSDSTNDTK